MAFFNMCANKGCDVKKLLSRPAIDVMINNFSSFFFATILLELKKHTHTHTYITYYHSIKLIYYIHKCLIYYTIEIKREKCVIDTCLLCNNLSIHEKGAETFVLASALVYIITFNLIKIENQLIYLERGKGTNETIFYICFVYCNNLTNHRAKRAVRLKNKT
jgi:hypothetical protein